LSGAPRSFSARLEGIYAIVDTSLPISPETLLEQLLAGGIKLVQYRSKSGVERSRVRAMHARTQRSGALLIVNDDLEAALEADGLHAGQEDLSAHDIAAVRARLGTRIFGISCGTVREARSAAQAGADYLGVGPFAATATKLDAGPALGENGVRDIVAACDVPVAAIGGIGPANLMAVARTGAAMAAIVSALGLAPDPRAAARELVACWNELHA
jgi:thiamine-phosphate pyrophosphorylase